MLDRSMSGVVLLLLSVWIQVVRSIHEATYIQELYETQPKKRRPFGTKSGYDREDGIDPICWNVQVGPSGHGFMLGSNSGNYSNSSNNNNSSSSNDNTTTTMSSEFDALLNDLFNHDDRQAEIHAECPGKTSLNVDVWQKGKRNHIASTGMPCDFRIDLETNPQDINPSYQLAPNFTVWVRLILCDPIHVGFCSPYLDTRNLDMVLDDGILQDAEKYDLDATDTLRLRSSTNGHHLYSRYFKLTAQEQELSFNSNGSSIVHEDGKYIARANGRLTVPHGFSGTYLALSHAILFMADESNPLHILERMDVAVTIDSRVLTFEDPPTFLVITTNFKVIFLIFLIGALAFEGRLLFAVIKNKGHVVMQMSQGPFLVVLIVFCMVATFSCITFFPINDFFCNLRSPLLGISLHAIGAILVGRLWRVHSMLSTALRLTTTGRPSSKKKKHQDFIMAILDSLSDWRNIVFLRALRRPVIQSTRRLSLRRTVTNGELACLIVVLSLPQVFIQLAKVIFCPESLEIMYTEDRSTATEVCGPACKGYHFTSLFSGLMLYVLAVVMAWLSSDLPSIFNEREAIFSSSWINLFAVAFGLSMLLMTNDPSTSPNTRAFLYVGVVNTVVLSLCWMLLGPKLKRIMSGEKIVLSKLLDERDPFGIDSFTGEPNNSLVLGMTQPTPQEQESSSYRLPYATTSVPKLDMEGSSSNKMEYHHHPQPPLPTSHSNHQHHEDVSVYSGGDNKGPLLESSYSVRSHTTSKSGLSIRHVALKPHEAPPRRFEQQLLSVKDITSRVASRSLNGKQMNQSDWEALKAQSQILNEMLERIEYNWDSRS